MADNKFTNRDRLRRRMAAIPEAMKRRVHAALLQNANEFKEAAQRVVSVESGDLRDSHKVVDRTTPDRILIQASAGDERAFYARMVEFLGQPWFYPTYRSLKRRFKARVSRAGREGVKEALSRP